MFKQTILDSQDLIGRIEIIKRDYIFYDDLLTINKIVSFVWPRRVGKTFLMLSFVKKLIASGTIALDQIVFIDFSLYAGEMLQPALLLQNFKELHPKREPFFIFDEIQDIANFREFVLYLYNLWYKIFLSWSNSTLLSSELSTHFRWRVFEYKVLPLTFKEILRFKHIEAKNNYSSTELWVIKHIINEVLEFGTFPEILLANNNLFKIDNLKTYLDVMIYKDLMERYKIDNEVSMKYLFKSLTLSFTKNINITKVYNELKSLNIKIWKTTLYEYYEYMKNVFYVYELENFYNQKSFKKSFLYNIWFNRILWNKENVWQSFENLVFLELVKRFDKVYFKKNGWEIDFYVPEISTNIQVCFHLNSDNFKRELGVFGGNKEKNVLVYYTKDNFAFQGNNFELFGFIDFCNIYLW